MAATPKEIRVAIAAALTAAFAPDIQISPYRLPVPMTKCLQIIGTEAEYDQAMQRGVDYWTFKLQALAGSPISQVAQEQLDTWKAPAAGGVKAAIEDDPTLAGVVQTAQVQRASEDQIYVVKSNAELLGCTFDVFVVNTGH